MRFRTVVTGIATLCVAGCGASKAAPPDAPIGGPLGASIARGRALVLATAESLPTHVGNGLRCTSCHLDEGRRPQGTWIGVYARYPQYRSRNGAVQTLEGRVNDCFARSMNGTPLPPDGRDMADIVAYLWSLSRGTAIGPPPPPEVNRFAGLSADTGAGRTLYGASCAACHGAAGEGGAAPPVWGARSYNVGAGMARRLTAAAFVRANMPFNAPGTLTDQQALDVAAYVNAQSRPDYSAKLEDWPNGDPPPDVPYVTRAGRRPR